MNNNYAFFICSNREYIPFLNVLLNSIDKHKLDNVDVYLMYYEFDLKYLEKIKNSFNFNLIPIEIKKERFSINIFNKRNKNLFIKQARFKYIKEYGMKYDAICMLDADMFVTTHNFTNLFELVKGTNKLVGCNERYKWIFNHKYVYNEEKIFKKPVKAHKFHCSVPIVFDLKKWTDVFDYYNQIAYNAFEVDSKGKIEKPIGDIYCWNISVYKNNRQNDVILFPMETMTQVHQTNSINWTRLIKDNGIWLTYAGDEVFSIHGRIGRNGWRQMHSNKIEKIIQEGVSTSDTFINQGRIKSNMNKTLRLIEKEWYDLNVNHKVNIYDFFPLNKYWEQIK